MACSVHIRRFVAVLLCCVLAFHSALPVARAVEPVSASISIAAGAIALGGLSAAAVESTIGPQVAAIIGTTMQGLGTSVYTAEDSAVTKTKFIMEKIALWSVQAKMAKEDFYKAVASGVSVAGNGVIQLSHDASKLISQFISWLFESGQVASSIPTPAPSYPSASGPLNVGITQPFEFVDHSFSFGTVEGYTFSATFSDSISCVLLQPSTINHVKIQCIFCSSESGQVITINDHNKLYTITTSSSYTYNNKTVYYSKYDASYTKTPVSYLGSLPYSFSSTTQYNPAIAWTTIYGDVVKPESPVVSDGLLVGSESDWAQNQDLLNPSIDDVTTLTPDLINNLIDQLADGQTATMDIASYLESLVDAFDGVKAQVAELTDAVTGAKTEVANPDAIDTVVTVDPVNPITVPAVEPVELTPGGTIEGFSFPLDEIFPFCIPFDVVAALKLFDVPAEAPFLHVHWELPYNIVFDFDLDLSAYDDVAALLRVMETILFAVGLAVATRSLYIRS